MNALAGSSATSGILTTLLSQQGNQGGSGTQDKFAPGGFGSLDLESLMSMIPQARLTPPGLDKAISGGTAGNDSAAQYLFQLLQQ